MSDVSSPVAPSEKAEETLDFVPDQDLVDRNLAGEAQVAADGRNVRDATDISRRRTLVREADDAMQAVDTSQYAGISVGDISASAVNSPNTRMYDAEKMSARDAVRSVPKFKDAAALIRWVNRDPQRAEALILAERTSENPREELIKVVSTYVGTSGADVRAEAQAEARDADIRREAARAAFREENGIHD